MIIVGIDTVAKRKPEIKKHASMGFEPLTSTLLVQRSAN